MSQTSTRDGSDGMGTDAGRPPTDGLATMAHETIDQLAGTAHRAANEVRGAATRTVETAKRAQEHAVAAADANLRKARSYVERNPLRAVGIAVAVGALLMTLFRR
jgi:ElaB/YqjD/DUF883 family membrane-anchored ribosome-binding protein